MVLIDSILDPRLKLIFIEFCYERAFDVEEEKKRIDCIHTYLYKLYNEYADAAKVQPSIDLSELTFDLDVQSDANSVFFYFA